MPTGVYKRTAYHKSITSKALKGILKGRPFSREHCKNISKALRGGRKSKATIKKIIRALKGKKLSRQHSINIGLGHSGRNNYLWKPFHKLNYGNKHKRIRKIYGKADRCENNKCKGKSKNYDWANISKQYKRNRKDWIRLCKSCHIFFDKGQLKIKDIL